MSMNNENVVNVNTLDKSQLYPRGHFISYCNNGGSSHSDFRRVMEIDDKFLDALEKDGFLKPVLVTTEVNERETASKEPGQVKYYSPFQIFNVAELSENIFFEGELCSKETLRDPNYYKQHNFRLVTWGWRGGGFNFAYYSNVKNKRFKKEFNPLLTAASYGKFVSLVHSLKPLDQNELPYEQMRYYRNSPPLFFHLEPLRSDGKNYLKKFGLDIKQLNALRAQVGHFAQDIDPMERWYYLVKRIARHKKELLKGDAALAQRLYEIYDLLTEIVEAVTAKPSKPLLAFLELDGIGRGYLSPRNGFQSGEDVQALKYAIQQFNQWRKSPQNKKFVSAENLTEIKEATGELADYEKRYGDKSYAGSLRSISNDDELTLDDLDEKAKAHIAMIQRQSAQQKYKINLNDEIARVIMHRLDDIKRTVRGVFWDISKKFRELENSAWETHKHHGDTFWWKNAEQLKNMSREKQLEWSNREREKLEKEAKKWAGRGQKFNEQVQQYADLVFCKSCRKNPVLLHVEESGHNLMESSRAVICDQCLKTGGYSRLNGGEWNCSRCDRLLYKFVSQNAVGDTLINRAPANITLEYGRLKIVAICPYKDCGAENERAMESGWLA